MKNMDADLVVKSLENACLNVKNINEIIVDIYLGAQYTNQKFEEIIRRKEMLNSSSRKARPYYNSCIESFH